MTDLERWLAPRLERVERGLADRFVDVWPSELGKALAYPVSTGGKRIRPAFALAAYEAVCGAREIPAGLIAAAVAVELVHTYSLVHDDLPCMDDDDVRRGKPTVHRVHGEGAAVLVGDGLLTDAFAVLAAAPLPAEVRIALVAALAEGAGAGGMIGGQAADIGMGGVVADLDTLERLHAGKTGALITAAAVMGGIVAGAHTDALDALRRYGRAVGLAFQLADDGLDAEGDAGADGPPSFVRLLGQKETARRAAAFADEALEAIADLPDPAQLSALARFAVQRDH